MYLNIENKIENSCPIEISIPRKILALQDKKEGRTQDVSPATTGGIKCFNCGKLGHRASECFSRVQERNSRKSPCYRCGEFGHTFMQYERGNRLAHGGASAREKAYKIAFAVLSGNLVLPKIKD